MSNDSSKTSGNVVQHFFRASAADFKKIPGSPIAYWISDKVHKCYSTAEVYLSDICDIREGINTGDNDNFLRLWQEVDASTMQLDYIQVDELMGKWFPHRKGGHYRKWAGNMEYVMNWEGNGRDIHAFHNLPLSYNGAPVRGKKFFFKEALSWSRISSDRFSIRYHQGGSTYDSTAPSIFVSQAERSNLLSFLNGKIVSYLLSAVSPTLDFRITNLGRLPLLPINDYSRKELDGNTKKLIKYAQSDWDEFEKSWNFSTLPFLNSQTVGRVSDSVTRQLETANVGLRDKAANPTYPLPLSIKETYSQLRAHWQELTLEMQCLEQENNRIFIDAYGLQDELTSDVSLKEITLTCNPYYRYGKEPRINTNGHEKENQPIRVNSCSLVVQNAFPEDTELEERLLADTMKEFISYAVGCMFGRYSLDKPGLILANQGETTADYYKKLQEPRIDTNGHEVKNQEDISVNSCSLVVQKSEVLFPADDDNVIPMLDGDWFTDDITERFCKFLKVTFGDDHYEENLKFIEKALGKDIRKYFLKDFYNDHVRRYKKRPIYWLFSSPKGTFNALVYMHRYRPDTVSVVLNDYLREFRTKLSARKNHLEAVSISSSSSAGEKTKALKDIESHRKMIDELDSYEREVLYPIATEQKEINLDDGVKVNYQKFGEALKKIPGLAAKDEE